MSGGIPASGNKKAKTVKRMKKDENINVIRPDTIFFSVKIENTDVIKAPTDRVVQTENST